MTDFEAWMELCDLYLSQQDYTKAAFCVEELLMSNPHNHLYHQKYAEVRPLSYTPPPPPHTHTRMELCDLYLSQQDYTKAAFCVEELLMSNPHNHLYHQKYAEVRPDLNHFNRIPSCLLVVVSKHMFVCDKHIENY